LSDDECYTVDVGDRLGFTTYNMGVSSLSIGYVFNVDAQCVVSVSTVSRWNYNETKTVVEFDRLQLPYQPLLSALVDTGQSLGRTL
jgi:hypothetical protein